MRLFHSGFAGRVSWFLPVLIEPKVSLKVTNRASEPDSLLGVNRLGERDVLN
jgi:hypothetical protein